MLNVCLYLAVGQQRGSWCQNQGKVFGAQRGILTCCWDLDLHLLPMLVLPLLSC